MQLSNLPKKLLLIALTSFSLAGIVNGAVLHGVSFSHRFRVETLDNVTTLADSANKPTTYTRQRTLLGLSRALSANASVKFQLGNEFRYYLAPVRRETHLDELFIDQLYVTWTGLPGGLTATIGRQNIFFGEGFVLNDGTPLDGSRTGYYNAVRLDMPFGESRKGSLIVFQQERTDHLLPVLNDLDKPLVEQTSNSLVLYTSPANSALSPDNPLIWEAWYVLKSDQLTSTLPESIIHAIGGNFKSVLPLGFTGRGEAGVQIGDRDSESRFAWATSLWLNTPSYSASAYKLEGRAGFFAYSGDDPATSEVEGWDPLFSRAPVWCDSYISTMTRFSPSAWWSNLNAPYLKGVIKFDKGQDIAVTYYLLSSPESPSTASSFLGSGTEVGKLLTVRANFKAIDPHFFGHVQYERLFPGDFFFDGADDYTWIRFELSYSL